MRAWRAAVAVVAAGAALPVGVPAAGCASDAPAAALVVDTGESPAQTMCVQLPSSSVSGLQLIRLAGEQYGLEYAFGSGGQAVCMLAGVGPTGDDCFEDYPNFWGYWRGTRTGGWSWSSSGAGSTTVTDGDVEGWSWGSGDNGDSHPQPPVTRYADACSTNTEGEPNGDSTRESRGGEESELRGTPVATGNHDGAGAATPERASAIEDQARRDEGRDNPPRRPSSRVRRSETHATSPAPAVDVAAPSRSTGSRRATWLPSLAVIFLIGALVLWGLVLGRRTAARE